MHFLSGPAAATNAYRLLVTLEPAPAADTPRRAVLEELVTRMLAEADLLR